MPIEVQLSVRVRQEVSLSLSRRLGRELKWDPVKREILSDDQANALLTREYRKGYEIKM